MLRHKPKLKNYIFQIAYPAMMIKPIDTLATTSTVLAEFTYLMKKECGVTVEDAVTSFLPEANIVIYLSIAQCAEQRFFLFA